MKKFMASMAAVALLVTPMVATADTEYWSNSSWAVYEMDGENEGTCWLGTVDKSNGGGDLYSSVILSPEIDSVLATFKSYDWTINDESIEGMSVFLRHSNAANSTDYSGGDWSRVDRNTFMAPMNRSFLDDYARATALGVFKEYGDDEVLVAYIDLTGSGVGVQKLRACVRDAAARIQRKAERERIRPTNPF